jgi:uncharacterized protein (DUF433 family)
VGRGLIVATTTPTRSPDLAGPAGTRIVCDSAIQGGEPTVRGTRTTVRSVVIAARASGDLAGVLYDFPHLSAEDVADALAYYERHRDAVDALIREFGDGGS